MTPVYTQLLLIRPPHSTRPLLQVPHMTLSDPSLNAVYRSVCSNLPNSGFHMTWVCPCPPRCPRSFPFCTLHVLDARFFSQFARLVRSPSSASSKSARTGRTSVRPSIALETCPPVESADFTFCLPPHRAHTARARWPQTMRASLTQLSPIPPSTLTTTTCPPSSQTRLLNLSLAVPK
jgi:hypothetical protein